MYVHVRVRAFVCACIHIFVCAHVYLYTHKQTFTHIVKEWGRQPAKHSVCNTRCFVLETILAGSSDAFLLLFPVLCIDVHKFEDVC